jgi:regulator of protease activity HflC (stomatin/prohibitin superfamily)
MESSSMFSFFSDSAIAVAIYLLIAETIGLTVLQALMFFTVVREGKCKVYVLFGKVIHTITEPGLHFLWPALTWRSFVIKLLGEIYEIDMRMDQLYLRSQPVNSEEGAPMGVGIWYEMYINNPVSYLFKNSDPGGSLMANVSNATVRCLSNLPLSKMLSDRHSLSQIVRAEVTQKSQDWGYKLGSVYVRKVHFRDENMIHEIEGKVVNRLRQVTAAIKQDGDNQVHVITNTAQRTASIEFAKAGAVRPRLVGQVLKKMSEDSEVTQALFEVLETQKILENPGELILIPAKNELIKGLLAGGL